MSASTVSVCTAEHWTPLDRIEDGCTAPCGWCERTLTAGDLALMSPDAAWFYCVECVGEVYEAMKAARIGTAVDG